MNEMNEFKKLLIRNKDLSKQLVNQFDLVITQDSDNTKDPFINEIISNKLKLKELHYLRNLISNQIIMQRKEEERLITQLDIQQNWIIKEKLEDKITVESENVIYSLGKHYFDILFKNKQTEKSILFLLDKFENSHENMNVKELENLKQSIIDGTVSFYSFRWFNTWIVTKGKSWGHGKFIANKISKLIFGLDHTDLPRLAGQENKRNFDLTNSYVYTQLYDIISNKFDE